MTPEDFVAEIKRVVFDYVSEGTLQPHGRQRDKVKVRVWDWYTKLSSQDQALVRHAMRIAAYSAVFGLFIVLDGMSAIGPHPHGELRLIYTDLDGSEQLLNPPDENLHILWMNELFPDTESPPELDLDFDH
jgi:hypothetical protein